MSIALEEWGDLVSGTLDHFARESGYADRFEAEFAHMDAEWSLIDELLSIDAVVEDSELCQ